MSHTLTGNAIIAQSGGPTAVINATAYGILTQLRQYDCVRAIYGASHGILGVLREELFDFAAESPQAIEALQWTPAAAIGSCRYKVRQRDYSRILEVFAAHNIRYFFYIGGNDSADTALQVQQLAQQHGYELRVLGVMKTIDNDLMETDHCPGYGSAAKYVATAVREAGLDAEAMCTQHQVVLIETMGRNAGWLAAAAGLARTTDEEAPHLILFPERAFQLDRFLGDLEKELRRRHVVVVAVSEGLRNGSGQYLSELFAQLLKESERPETQKDQFGHIQLGGAAAYLHYQIQQKLRIRSTRIWAAGLYQGQAEDPVRSRYNLPGTQQRNAGHWMSRSDRDEALRCGRAAASFAIEGYSGYTVGLRRLSDEPYVCEPVLIELSKVANLTRKLPDDFMEDSGHGISHAFRRYARPLVQGRVEVPEDEFGLPRYARLEKKPIPQRLAPWKV